MHKIFRSAKPHQLFPTSSFTSLSDNNSVVIEVLSLINSANPIGYCLNKISPLLNRDLVVSVIQSQAQLKTDPRICFRFFIWSSGELRFQNQVSHNLIIDLLLSGHSFDLYWSVLDDFRSERIPISANAFVVLMLAYWRLKDADKAVQTFEKMKDYECQPNRIAYNILLNVLVKKNVILLALAIYNVILKLNLEIRADTFNVLIDGLCKSGMNEDALNLFDDMAKRGISPTVRTYTVVMSGLCKSNKMDEAIRFFHLMKSRGCKPDDVMCTVLLNGLCKVGRVNEAFVLLNSFKSDGYRINVRALGCLINGLIRINRISEAEELFSKTSELNLLPDVVLYTIMMKGLCGAGRVEGAANMLRDMIGKGIKPDTECYNVLIKGFCDLGFLDEARSLQLDISRQALFPNTCTCTILICGLCRNGLMGEAQQIFDDMEKFGCFPSVVTFNALINGLCKSGNLEEAHLMLYKMEIGRNPSLFLRLSQGADRVIDSTSLQKMIQKMVDSGDVLRSFKLLERLSDRGIIPDIKTYNILINGMCKAGQISGAFKLFEELQLKGHLPDTVTYTTLINGLHRLDREADAMKLFEQMVENGCKHPIDAYKAVMTWSCRRNKLSVACGIWLRYLRGIAGWKDEALELVEKYLEKGAYEDAVRCLLENDIEGETDSAFYSIWLIGLCQANKIKEAHSTFYILEESGIPVSASGYVKLIHGLCLEEKFNQAVDIFTFSMDKGLILMPQICNRLLQSLFVEDTTLALNVVSKMKSVGYDLNSYLHYGTKFFLYHLPRVREFENFSTG